MSGQAQQYAADVLFLVKISRLFLFTLTKGGYATTSVCYLFKYVENGPTEQHFCDAPDLGGGLLSP